MRAWTLERMLTTLRTVEFLLEHDPVMKPRVRRILADIADYLRERLGLRSRKRF